MNEDLRVQSLFQPRGNPASGDSSFVWAVGVENTSIPQSRPGHRALDEYALTGHDRLWREDLGRIAGLGVRAVRYGIPWHRVNPAPGRFDWRWTDEVLPHIVEGLGLVPIVDLVHFGTPTWLGGEFLAPDYPARVAEYAGAVARRYGSLVGHFTPLNEPAVTADRSGRLGAWPPYRRGARGYVAVLLAAARGMVEAAASIRAEQPAARFVHAEDVGLELAATANLAAWAAARQARRWLPLDLACGLVGAGHPLRPWLVEHGADPGELDRLAGRAPPWDVIGVNFYPWSNRRWRRRPAGAPALGRDPGDPAAALATVLGAAHARYGRPVMVTETAASGSMARRLGWMAAMAEGVDRARRAGVPVVGLTWFPAFTMVDWRYRRSRRGVEHHRLHLGLWDVPGLGASFDRAATPLVEAYRGLVGRPVAPLGGGGDAANRSR